MCATYVPLLPLRNTTALVTGGGSGLGQAFAEALATAGARVAILGRTLDRLNETAARIRAQGGDALPVSADVSDAGGIPGAVSRVRHAFGPISLLVNNAGTLGPIGPDWEVDPADWWRTFEVNILGAANMVRAVLPDMIEQGAGRIVNISSSAAYNLQPHYAAYGASKAALSYWSASIARALEPHGVRVFAYAPGFVRTSMTERLAVDPEARRWIGDGVERAFSKGRDIPVEQAVGILMEVAVGNLDSLSGRHIDARDDVEELRRLADHIVERNLYVLRRQELD